MCGIIAYCPCDASVLAQAVHDVGRTGYTPPATRWYDVKPSVTEQLEQSLDRMRHRGPDGSSIWMNNDSSVGLGHCRLSINDLSPAGMQPLHHDKIHAVINGEIYDYDTLRDECESAGYKFSSRSDSELVLALYRIHGCPGLFSHLRGEFAFVIFDEEQGKVVAARDRYGIKPMFWALLDGKLCFATEAKGLLPLGWAPEWDVRAIAKAGWMVDDRTVFHGVRKLEPGQYVEVTAETVQFGQFWDMDFGDKMQPETRTIDEVIAKGRELLVDAVRQRMKADVPVGVFLSGGIDSSCVAGIVKYLASQEDVDIGNDGCAKKLHCYNIQLPSDSGYDESDIATRTCDWLDVELHKVLVDEEAFADNFEETCYHAEHHFPDNNSVAKFILSELPRDMGVKVILTGEGSDEHFAGYSFVLPEILREPDYGMPDSKLTKSNPLREALHKTAASETANIWCALGGLKPSGAKPSSDAPPSTMYHSMTCLYDTAMFEPWVSEKHGAVDMALQMWSGLPREGQDRMRNKWHPGHNAMYIMNKTALQNIILSSMGDRAEMAHSVEGRPPFLDHKLTEYIDSLPPSLKTKLREDHDENLDTNEGFWWKSASQGATRAFTEKWLLREMVKPFVTEELYRRRKQPFLTPSRWPKDGPLQNMHRRILTKEAVQVLGFVRWDVVRQALEDAFGDDARPAAFRMVTTVAGWVTLASKFGVETAKAK